MPVGSTGPVEAKVSAAAWAHARESSGRHRGTAA